MRRIAPVLLAALLLGGCGADERPQVGFAAGAASVQARPAQYCDVKLTDCQGDPQAPVQLAVPVGTPLRVSVPPQIAQTPWHVVFSYRNAAGEQVDGRSPLFAAGQREEYALELPDPADRLLTAQVQQFGPPPQADAGTGEIQFPIRASWVLTATG